jgi:hypothetical protein
MRKEAVVAWFKVLSRHLPGRTEENHKNLSQDSWFPGRDLNPGPPEYETGVLTTRPRLLVTKTGVPSTQLMCYISHMKIDH